MKDLRDHDVAGLPVAVDVALENERPYAGRELRA
jgi:hypothetical protein